MKSLTLLTTILIVFYVNQVYSNNLFETSYYNIDFVSKNIEYDKIEEIKRIKIKSLSSILKKTLLQNKYEELQAYLTEDFVNPFIKNIVINDEKIINDRYVSKVKINFNKKKIIKYFRENNISYIEYYPNKFLLIIYEINKINHNLFTKNNNYYNYINKNLDMNNIFVIPNLDINDRYILKKEDIENRNLEKINNFSKKYNLNEIIIVVAKKDKIDFNYNLIIYSNGKNKEKKLNFNKYKLDEFFQILENETLDMWKSINKIQNTKINIINCKVNYFNMLELKEIRKKLNNVSTIKESNTKSISIKNIEYEIKYFGDLSILKKLFKLNKLKINNIDDNCLIKLI